MSANPVQIIRGAVTYRHDWQAIDWAMKSITVAMHLCAAAGLIDLCDQLSLIHRQAQARRDAS